MGSKRILMINTGDLKEDSVSISENIDDSKLRSKIYITQDIKIFEILGTHLYEQIVNGIENDTLSTTNKNLLETYIQPVLIHYTLSDLFLELSVSISDNGAYKKNVENGQVLSDKNVSKLIKTHEMTASKYKDRLITHLCYNTTLYPAYNQSVTNDESTPSRVNNRGLNWF